MPLIQQTAQRNLWCQNRNWMFPNHSACQPSQPAPTNQIQLKALYSIRSEVQIALTNSESWLNWMTATGLNIDWICISFAKNWNSSGVISAISLIRWILQLIFISKAHTWSFTWLVRMNGRTELVRNKTQQPFKIITNRTARGRRRQHSHKRMDGRTCFFVLYLHRSSSSMDFCFLHLGEFFGGFFLILWLLVAQDHYDLWQFLKKTDICEIGAMGFLGAIQWLLVSKRLKV